MLQELHIKFIMVLRAHMAALRIRLYGRMNLSSVSMEERARLVILEGMSMLIQRRTIGPDRLSTFGHFRIQNTSFGGAFKVSVNDGTGPVGISDIVIDPLDTIQVIVAKLNAGKIGPARRFWLDSDLRIWLTVDGSYAYSAIEVDASPASGNIRVYDVEGCFSGGIAGEIASGCECMHMQEMIDWLTTLLKENCKAPVQLSDGFIIPDACCVDYLPSQPVPGESGWFNDLWFDNGWFA